jgi:hypothetical protein
MNQDVKVKTSLWIKYEWWPADGSGHCEAWQAGPFKNMAQLDKFLVQLHTTFQNAQIKNVTIEEQKTKGIPNVLDAD